MSGGGARYRIVQRSDGRTQRVHTSPYRPPPMSQAQAVSIAVCVCEWELEHTDADAWRSDLVAALRVLRELRDSLTSTP